MSNLLEWAKEYIKEYENTTYFPPMQSKTLYKLATLAKAIIADEEEDN